MQGDIRKVNDMSVDERWKINERYKEHDGIYLVHIVLWFISTFFRIIFFNPCIVITMMIAKHNGDEQSYSLRLTLIIWKN